MLSVTHQPSSEVIVYQSYVVFIMMATEEGDTEDWDAETGKLLNVPGVNGSLEGDIKAETKFARPRQRPPPPPQRGQANMSMCGLLSLEFYRPYFNVDTVEVNGRLLQAAWPLRRTRPFLPEDVEDGNALAYPDLYGPVWVSATLIFVLSVVNTARRGTESGEFDKVSTSMYSVLAYVAIGAVGLWAFFRAHAAPLAGAEALSVYGYSLTPFLVTSPLCLLSWTLRWLALSSASVFAAIFVLRCAWPRLQEHTPERSTIILLASVAVYHISWFLFLAVF